MMTKAEEEIEAFKRKLLSERLALLTEKQRKFLLTKLFPSGEVPADKLIGVLDLCDRTIAKNQLQQAVESQKHYDSFDPKLGTNL